MTMSLLDGYLIGRRFVQFSPWTELPMYFHFRARAVLDGYLMDREALHGSGHRGRVALGGAPVSCMEPAARTPRSLCPVTFPADWPVDVQLIAERSSGQPCQTFFT